MSGTLFTDAPRKDASLANAEGRSQRFYLAWLVSLLTILAFRVDAWLAEGVMFAFGLGALAFFVYATGIKRGQRDQ